MRNNLIFLAITILIINGCNKDKTVVKPISSFSFQNDTLNTLKVATSDSFALTNTSKNADSIFWDFGDGRTSKENNFFLSYPKSGSYTIKLTTKNNDGQKSTISKNVIVLDRIIKNIEIAYVQWDSTNLSEGWPASYKVDIYFQIQMYNNDTKKLGIYPNCPVLFTSPIVKNVNNHFYPPLYPAIEIPITEKFVIDRKMVVDLNMNTLNKSYLFSVMAKDSNGKVYCLVNNIDYGAGILDNEDFTSNSYTIGLYWLTSFKLICDFE